MCEVLTTSDFLASAYDGGSNPLLAICILSLGAYGTAVLYRKKDDDSLVILKEINLHDLNVSERQLAQNEVSQSPETW